MGYYGYGHPMMWGGDSGFIGGLFTIFWIFVLVVAIIALVRYMRHGKVGHWHSGSALGILRERFAKGEIDTAEFQERKKALEE